MNEILEQPTIARAFLRSVADNDDRVAVREFGTGRADHLRRVARALRRASPAGWRSSASSAATASRC